MPKAKPKSKDRVLKGGGQIAEFHRGISLALLFLAGLILSLEIILQTATADLMVLLGAMVPVAVVTTRLGFGNGRFERG
jgi:hypothetical protein